MILLPRRYLVFGVLILTAVGSSQYAFSLGQPQYVSNAPSKGGLTLAAGGQTAMLYVDAQDYPGVIRAAHDLQADIKRVTGVSPNLVSDKDRAHGEVVIIGTISKSALIDRLIREHKLDASEITGKWESTVIQVVEKPMPGVARALVIAGSDKRGTIFGIYDL